MGSGAAIIGICMIVRIHRIQTGKNYQRAYRKVKKFMKTEVESTRLNTTGGTHNDQHFSG